MPNYSTQDFLNDLGRIGNVGKWTASLNDSCIHLKLEGSEMIFTPLTAVHFLLTGQILHRGSFWMEEMTTDSGFPWWEILEVSYAVIACDCSRKYDRHLRNGMLEILGLPFSPCKTLM
jgi:hypothetical protein